MFGERKNKQFKFVFTFTRSKVTPATDVIAPTLLPAILFPLNLKLGPYDLGISQWNMGNRVLLGHNWSDMVILLSGATLARKSLDNFRVKERSTRGARVVLGLRKIRVWDRSFSSELQIFRKGQCDSQWPWTIKRCRSLHANRDFMDCVSVVYKITGSNTVANHNYRLRAEFRGG